MNFDAEQPQTFPHAKCRMDTVVHLTGRHAGLVVGAARGPGPQQPPGICAKSMCIISSAKSKSHVMGVDNDHSVPPAHWSLLKYKFMLPPDPTVQQQRLLTGAAMADPCLHEGPSILGGESHTANPQ